MVERGMGALGWKDGGGLGSGGSRCVEVRLHGEGGWSQVKEWLGKILGRREFAEEKEDEEPNMISQIKR